MGENIIRYDKTENGKKKYKIKDLTVQFHDGGN